MSNEKRYENKWLIILALSTGTFMATVDGSIVNVCLPVMVKSLGTNFTIIQWVVLSYLLTVTTTMLGFGRLGDILGKKRIYLLGFGVFILASALCGFAANVYLLISARVIQGIGAAMTMALGPAILTESCPPEERGKVMGIIGSVVSIGIITGPALGGLLVELLSYHWIFFVNIPVGLAGIFIVFRYIPNIPPAGRQRFDFPGAVLLFVSLLTLLAGLSLGQQTGFTKGPLVPGLLVASLFLLLLFVRVERGKEQPMIQLALFKNSLLTINLVTALIMFIALGGTFILLPFYLENILQVPPIRIGLLMSIIPVMMGIVSPFAGNLSDRLGSRPISLTALFILILGYLILSTLALETSETGFVLRVFLLGIGLGLFVSPNNSAIMGTARKHQLGVVSGLMAISRTLGQTVGVSVIGTLWAVKIRLITSDPSLVNVTEAPRAAQVQGITFVSRTVAVMVAVAFLLSAYGCYMERREKKQDRKDSGQTTGR